MRVCSEISVAVNTPPPSSASPLAADQAPRANQVGVVHADANGHRPRRVGVGGCGRHRGHAEGGGDASRGQLLAANCFRYKQSGFYVVAEQ